MDDAEYMMDAKSFLPKNVIFSAHMHIRDAAYISFITSNYISTLDSR